MTFSVLHSDPLELGDHGDILRHLRLCLSPPPLALATAEQILARAGRGQAKASLARITGGWIALVGLAAAMVGCAALVAPSSSALLSALRHTPGGLGLLAGASALLAVMASPALVILGNPRPSERSIQ